MSNNGYDQTIKTQDLLKDANLFESLIQNAKAGQNILILGKENTFSLTQKSIDVFSIGTHCIHSDPADKNFDIDYLLTAAKGTPIGFYPRNQHRKTPQTEVVLQRLKL